jgi:endoglucanase
LRNQTMHRRTVLKHLGAGATLAASRSMHAFAQTLAASGPSILFNQAGFHPGAEKIAAVQYTSSPANPAASFHLRDRSSGKILHQGSLSAPLLDPASGDFLQEARFTALLTPGTYRLEVDGLSSDPFPIAPDAYAAALRTSMHGFTGQRCGCAVDLGGGYKHAPCHLSGAYHPSSGKSGSVPNHGGWHDAGDYGRYSVNSSISTATLLWAWELYPQALHRLSLAIAGSGGKLPDYLAELRWNIEWMLQLQDADGGVWHKQTSEQFCGFIMPQEDHLTSYVIGTGAAPFKSTCATADLASVAAIAARCYKPYDPSFASHCLEAARRAWSWAQQHPSVTFTNPPGIGTGGYEDSHGEDELLWASAELWRTTGDAQYEQAFLTQSQIALDTLTIEAPSWSSVASMAYWTYALAARSAQARGRARDRIRAATAHSAAELATRSESSGYGNTLAPADYIWGSNAIAANQSLLLLMADHFSPDKRFAAAAMGNLHYLLGRNCHGVSWVTHVGTRPFQHPHHRPSAADGIAEPWPGLLSGGPNAHGGDPIADAIPKMPPMRMWIDHQAAYSMNEIAINWNAPLVFLLAAANARSL